MADAVLTEDPGALQDADMRVDGEQVDPAPDPGSWIPDAYRQNASVTRYETLEKFIDGSLEREKLIGRTIQPLDPAASVEDQVKFYKELPGMPKDAAGYEVDPLSLPDGMPHRINSDALLDVMHNNGVPRHAVNAVMRFLEQHEEQAWRQAQDQDREYEEAAVEALGRVWGHGFVERNLKIGLEGLRREFGDVEWLGSLVAKDSEGNERLLENSPQFAQMAYEFARSRGHDRFVPGGVGMPHTVEQARKELHDARQSMSAGSMSIEEYNALELRLAPIAYGHPDENSDDDVRIGAPITAIDLGVDER